MKKLINLIDDNAIFYKDITQWLRNKSFTTLFFILLGLSIFIAITLTMEISGTNPNGADLFQVLYVMLWIYASIIAVGGYIAGGRDFSTNTFELYELSGISPEKVVFGKVISMMNQFLFGFFCVVPFMFFSYFLGGMDFVDLIAGIIIQVAIALFVYNGIVLISTLNKYKQLQALGRFGNAFFIFIMIYLFFPLIFGFAFGSTSGINVFGNLLKEIFSGDVLSIVSLIAIALFYITINALVFYMNAHAVCRENDSREVSIKFTISLLAFEVALSVFVISLFSTSLSGFSVYTVIIGMVSFLIYILTYLLGLMFLINKSVILPVVQRRINNASPLKKLIYKIFKPGIFGTITTMLFIFGLAILLSSAPTVNSTLTSAISSDWYKAVCFLIQTPWFIAVPFMIFRLVPMLRNDYIKMRILTVLWWIVANIAFTMLTLTTSNYSVVAKVFGPLLTPITSMMTFESSSDSDYLYRIVLGGLGILFSLMIWSSEKNSLNQLQKQTTLPEGESDDSQPESN